jgi:integrase
MPIYLTALYTGLRRDELQSLQWGDVHLDAEPPYLSLRGSTTKNKQTDKLPLYEAVARVLKEIRPANATEGDPVFPRLPGIKRFKSDLKKAGIPFIDGQGHRLDFHALRHTFCTIVGGTGIVPLVQKRI